MASDLLHRPLRARTRPGQRGFSLIELIVVVVIISVLAVLATPSITRRMRDRRTMQAAHEIASIYRDARMRALGRGSAVLVRFTNGAFQMREAVRGNNANEPDAFCQALPVSSCTTPAWETPASATNRMVRTFQPGTTGVYEGLQLEVADPAGTAVTVMDVCFTPTGRSFIRYNVAADAPFTAMAGVPMARVWREDGGGEVTGLERRVLILPTGNARLGTAGQR